MLSGDIHSEISRREVLLKALRNEKVAGLELAGDVNVRVFVTAGNEKRSAFVACLYKHLIDFPESPLCIEFHVPSFQSSHVMTVKAADMLDNDKRMAAVTHPLLSNNMILKGLMTALEARSLPFDYELYLNHLQVTVDSLVQLKKAKPTSRVSYPGIICAENVATVFSFNGDEKMLEANIRIIWTLLALGSNMGLAILKSKISPIIFKRIIKQLDTEFPLLHLFLKNKVTDESAPIVVRQLLDLLDEQPFSLTDDDGNNLFHVCRFVKALPLLQPYVKDVNSTNHAGNTALHQAALDGDLEKYQALVKLGADFEKLNSDGLKPILLVPESDLPFSVFANCHRYGAAIKNMPFVANQHGQTCGIYAVFNATNYHWYSSPGLFKSPPFPARKRDAEAEVEFSLRRFAKENNDTNAGEMLHSDGISYLIAKNNCIGITTKPASYKQFLEDIANGLKQNCPVIIPYSKDLYNQSNPQAYEAHWSTVIGSYEDPLSKIHYLLLAHYGGYEKVEAEKLYRAFSLIEDTFPKCYLFKKEGRGWDKSRTDNFGQVEKSVELDERDLNEGFKGRLITVLPPRNK